MDLNSIVNVTISAASPALTKIGFGEPGLYGHVLASIIPASSRTRRYSSSTGLSDMVADGFAVSDPMYRAAQKVLAQSPRPPTFKVLCGRSSFTFGTRLTVPVVASPDTIEVTVIGENPAIAGANLSTTVTVTGTGNANADAASLEVALKATGFDPGTVTFTNTGAPSAVIDVAGQAANDLCYFDNLHNLTLIDNQGDRGVAADLGAVITADADWYEMIPVDAFGSAELELLSNTIQSATNKFMSAATQESEVIAGTGIGHDIAVSNNNRTSLWFSKHSMGEYLAASVAGKFLPEKAGTIARCHKSVTGVTPSTLTTAESGFAHADFVNTYEGVVVGGVTIVSGNLYKGWSSGSTETFADTIRLIDALVAEVQSRVFSVFRASKKVPYTDKGIGQVKGAILAAIKVFQATNPPGLVPGSEFCNVPAAADISAANKAARTLPNVVFGATFAGAIATVTINGTLEY